MNLIKKAVFSLAAGAVIVAEVACSSLFDMEVRSGAGVKDAPITVEQTDAAGVSLTAEPLTARAGEVGVQEVSAQVDPSNAICDLEWTLAVGDSEIPEADMSDYLTIEETSATSIELVCHQRYDGFAELHVEDLLTGKTASASVTAWNYNISAGQYFSNSDFSENSSGSIQFRFPQYGGTATGEEQVQMETVDDWYMVSETDYAAVYAMGMMNASLGVFALSFMTPLSGTSYTLGFVQDIPTYQAGPNQRYTYMTPGTEWYVVVEKRMGGNAPIPELYSANFEDEYGSSGDFSVTQEGSWTNEEMTVIKFRVNEYSSYWNAKIGIGFTRNSGMVTEAIQIKSMSLYQGAQT